MRTLIRCWNCTVSARVRACARAHKQWRSLRISRTNLGPCADTSPKKFSNRITKFFCSFSILLFRWIVQLKEIAFFVTWLNFSVGPQQFEGFRNSRRKWIHFATRCENRFHQIPVNLKFFQFCSKKFLRIFQLDEFCSKNFLCIMNFIFYSQTRILDSAEPLEPW